MFYLLVVRQPNTSPTAINPSPLPSPIMNVATSSVASVAVKAKDKTGNQQVLTVTRNGSGWNYSLCPPDQAFCPAQEADATQAGNLVNTVATLRPTKTIFGAPDGLPAYGLDTPSTAEIDINTIGNQALVIFVGAKGIDKLSYFVRLTTSNNVFAVTATAIDGTILDALTNPPKPRPSPSPLPSLSPSPIVGPVASPTP